MKTLHKIFITNDVDYYKVNDFLRGVNDAKVVNVASNSKGEFLIVVEYKAY